MIKKKIKRLEKELLKYKKKLKQLSVDWAETRAGSCYGDEYGEVQIKVYQSMVEAVKKEISRLKKAKKG